MNLTWDLEQIYTSVNSDSYKKDLNEFENLINTVNQWAEKNFSELNDIGKKLEEFIILKNRLAFFDKLFIYCNLSQSIDTTDENISKALDNLNELSVKTTKYDVLFKMFLKKIDNIDTIISESNILKEHSYYLKRAKEESSHLVSIESESIISQMKNTGSVLWKKQWEQITSTLNVEIEINNNKEFLPLSVIRNMAYDSSSNIRKTAYFAELKAYEKIEKPSAFSLNGIKGEVINLCKIRNYKSPLEMTVIDSEMDMEILNTMFSAIKEKIPQIQKYFTKKSEILGHKNGLPFYDIFAPLGESELKFSFDEAREFIIKCFSEFSDKLGKFAENAFENRWIDVMPKEGKVGGAFCEAIHSIKQSRILTNFSATFNDVLTIAHELGHAYHDSCLYNETALNSSYPMPIAETASTFCETLIINSALKNLPQKERMFILENDISGMTQVIIDIYSRFLFEDEVFKRREKGALSVEELKEIMIKSQLSAYGKGLDENYLHPYMWICKPHYYDADFNYYNFPYAFGLLFSKGLFAKYLDNKNEFLKLYDSLLNQTGKNKLLDIAKMADINLYSRNFWISSLNFIEKEIEEFILL